MKINGFECTHSILEIGFSVNRNTETKRIVKKGSILIGTKSRSIVRVVFVSPGAGKNDGAMRRKRSWADL
jgi:hypothetical protein